MTGPSAPNPRKALLFRSHGLLARNPRHVAHHLGEDDGWNIAEGDQAGVGLLARPVVYVTANMDGPPFGRSRSFPA